MTVLDLIQLQIDLDVMDDVTGELYIAFVGPQLLTKEGEKEFADVLTMEVTINNDETLAKIHVDGPDGVWQQRLSNAKRFFYGAAGYVSEALYDRWFKDDEEDCSMLKDYIFHYNGDLKDEHEEISEGELTYHEHLMMEDGKHCKADVSSAFIEAYFDDGNELNVWIDELEEVK